MYSSGLLFEFLMFALFHRHHPRLTNRVKKKEEKKVHRYDNVLSRATIKDKTRNDGLLGLYLSRANI